MRRCRCRESIVAATVLCLAAFGPPTAAQQSASFRLDEQTFNAGGRPDAGAAATSASFRITLDSVGASIARSGELSGTNYRLETGFVSVYRPPGEARSLTFDADKQTLRWAAEPTFGDYTLYRSTLASLNGVAWGACLQSGIAGVSTTDAAVPAAGSGLFYLVAARNRLREEGPLGRASDGSSRVPSSVCP